MTSTVALIGTGLMGAPMSRNILKAGFALTVWNRTREKAEALVPDGARMADSASAAVVGADIVITMLENGPIVGDVLFARGVADALAPGALVIDMSSIPPDTARDHAARLAERGHSTLDAPVSGGVPGAEKGALAIMAGGEATDFGRAQPVFAAMGRATHVGPAGAGQLAKLANQTIVGVTITAVAEALLLAASGGADPSAVRQAISGGFADSIILQNHGGKMIDRNFMPGARASVQLKDLDTIHDTAHALGLVLPAMETVRGLYRDLIAAGDSDVDHNGVLLQEERINAPARLGDGADTRPD
jgi:2-hydroxy-3-oxopropionate reductase